MTLDITLGLISLASAIVTAASQVPSLFRGHFGPRRQLQAKSPQSKAYASGQTSLQADLKEVARRAKSILATLGQDRANLDEIQEQVKSCVDENRRISLGASQNDTRFAQVAIEAQAASCYRFHHSLSSTHESNDARLAVWSDTLHVQAPLEPDAPARARRDLREQLQEIVCRLLGVITDTDQLLHKGIESVLEERHL